MKVCNGALSIQPGSVNGESREPVLYYRGTSGINQIIVISNSGNISLDALYWCRDQGITLLLLDGKGNQVYSITPESKDSAPLRRLQYLASGTVKGGQLANAIVRAKTASQFDTVHKHPEMKNQSQLLGILDRALVELDSSDDRLQDVDYLRLYEGRLAASYFDSFIGLPIKWKASDAKIVAPHWKAITGRSSPVSTNGNGRNAVCPFHAALNYLYTVTEHQILVAIHRVGLDPACGFLHTDRENRDSLMYDLIEPLRSKVDDLVLLFFNRTVFKRGDIVPLHSGRSFIYIIACKWKVHQAISRSEAKDKRYVRCTRSRT